MKKMCWYLLDINDKTVQLLKISWRKAREKGTTYGEVWLDGKRASHRLEGRQGKGDLSCDLVFVNSD